MTHFSDIKYMDYESWFECWYSDSKNILAIMYSNMNSDIKAGYDVMGNTIKKELQEIEEYRAYINNTLDKFVSMDEKQIEKYCYFECLKKGCIE